MTMTNHLPEPTPAEPTPGDSTTAVPTPAVPWETNHAPLVEGEPTPAEPTPADSTTAVPTTVDSTPATSSETLAGALATPVEAPEPAPETPGRLEVTGEWRRVSPRAITIDLVGELILAVVVSAIALVLWRLIDHPWPLIAGGAIVLVTLVSAAFVPRRIRSIGYLLREDDLLFRRGIMWQRFVAVPYGRMQLVDINRGPLARAFGLAELKFVTASPAAGITIPGLPLDEAESLRDHLVSVAESRRTGL
jgi:membrane protein YdbS with pleckstrin-like domain